VPAVLFAGVLGFLAPIVCVWGDFSISNSLAAALLSLSTILAFATWRLHSTRLILVVGAAAGLTAAFVALFKRPGVEAAAYSAFACAILVIAITVALARTIVDQSAFRFGLDDAVSELTQRPHLVLWVLFILFLQITYLLALAVGIHNNASGGRALIRTQDDSKYAASPAAPSVMDDIRIIRYKAGCPGTACVPQELAVTVALNQPLLERLKKTADGERIPIIRKELSLDPTMTTLQTYSDEDIGVVESNAFILAELRAKVQRACQPGDASRPCMIEVLGHANDHLSAPTADALSKNDELAELRSEDVHLLLRKLVPGISIVWKIHSVGNNDTFLSADRDAFEPSADHKLCAEVHYSQAANSRAQLPLLDYLYFMIYTITTTGYGDLVPTDAFTQFVVSIANLYEMFFVVIVLNVLIKMPRKDVSKNPEVNE
jgi:hypothetical protein